VQLAHSLRADRLEVFDSREETPQLQSQKVHHKPITPLETAKNTLANGENLPFVLLSFGKLKNLMPFLDSDVHPLTGHFLLCSW
jgi:hypothetical protein